MKYLIGVVAVVLFTGCGAANNALVSKTKSVEYYRIFDIKTKIDRDSISELASNGLGRNVNNTQEAKPIPKSAIIPSTPGRLEVANPFEGTQLGMLALSGGGFGLKIATCKDAIWTANATRNVSGDSDLRITACLFQYQDGYHLDLYATFAKQEGGLMQISRSMAHAMVGTPEEWTEKAFLDIVREIRKGSEAEITLLEAYPKIQGTPWLDDGDDIINEKN